MNLHVARSYQTRVELEELAAVPLQVCTPQDSNPVMGLVQDSMLACFRWTVSDNYLNHRQMMKLIAWTNGYNGQLPAPDDSEKGWKANSILTSILPKFTYENKDDDVMKQVKITHGKYESGVWSKGSVGGSIDHIIHAVWKDYGPETTRLFMDNMMNLTMQWLLIDGFSVGVVDTIIEKETKEKVTTIINSVYDKVTQKITDLREGKLEVKFSNIPLGEQFENDMVELVDQVRNDAQSTTYKSLGKVNRIYSTVTSGSKGSPANIVQISSLLGQQMMEGGKRVHGGYQNRTLPHYAKFDLRPESHGLILGNFINGLNPAEYFMHAMSGREGVISTAIKTGITGYIQRKLIKVMEDLKIFYDNTVRNANNFIISHVYAGDSFDASKLEREKLKYFNMDPSGQKFKDEFLWTDNELKSILTPEAFKEWTIDVKNNYGSELIKEEYEQIIQDRKILREKMYPGKSEHGVLYSPIKFTRLLDWIKYTCGLDKRTKGDVSPLEIIQKVRAFTQDLKVSGDPIVTDICTRTFKFIIRNYLNSKRLIVTYKFTKAALDLILLKVKEHYLDTLINPGEMIGCISAQSIGEPLTQLTLDSFHKSGLGGRSKKLDDVPRLREIFSTTSNPKTPYMNIYITDKMLKIQDDTSHEEVIRRGEDYLDTIQYTTLNSLIESYVIVFDPDETKTIIAEDRVWLPVAHELSMSDINDIETPWLLRFKLNSEKIQNMKLTDITKKIEDLSSDANTLIILHTPKNARDVIIRVRVTTRGDDPKKELKDLTKQILMTPVKGISNILGGSIMSEDKDIIVNGEFISKTDKEYTEKHKYNKKIIKPDESKKIDLSTDKNEDNIIKELVPTNQQYLIQTEGSNLFAILALDGFDIYRTTSNDLHEVLEVLGIEAVREMIIQEIVGVFAAGGKTLNNRHIELLSDIMTAQGYLVSIDRYGVNKTDTGVLSRATFETTTNQIANASIFGEDDPMRGVSANIMFGQFFKGGTNSCDILLDEEAIMNADKLYRPKKIMRKKTLDYQETESMASCQNLDFEFSI